MLGRTATSFIAHDFWKFGDDDDDDNEMTMSTKKND